ncbi:hypothetical protein ONZ45_g635 [Pleurotus djamor]|nr:hypothetical protein ONZ45_g635 [Pleurotus djamor]
MIGNNPFGQAGWPNLANQNGRDTSGAPAPSTYGALPYYVPPTSNNTLFFQFTSFNPNILNSTVLGPQNQPYFRVVTDTPTPGWTVLQNGQGKNVAFVEWGSRGSHPYVEVKNVVPKQRVAEWIPLSPDRKYRTMRVGNKQYAWVPSGQVISLTPLGGSGGASDVLAKISCHQGGVFLEMTSQAINLGLLDAAIVVSFLLMCGRNVD